MTATKKPDFRDRLSGAIIGAFIGDALGVGPHWYYDLDEQRRQYGTWIDGYTEPQPDRYHAGLKPGELSQTGIITRLFIESLLDRRVYDESDFTARIDREILAHTDGTPNSGPGGFTHKTIRAAHARRVVGGAGWSELGTYVDNTEAAERLVPLAALYAKNPVRVAELSLANTRLLQVDPTIAVLTNVYTSVLAALVRGERLDGTINEKIRPEPRPDAEPLEAHVFGTYAAYAQPATSAKLVEDPEVRIEPASAVARVFGLSCTSYFLFPGVYYLAARFRDDFESAVLHALNGGGQNLARAYLTGALVGAQVGLSGIPQRFIDGLKDKDELLSLTAQLADLAEPVRARELEDA